MEKEIKFTIANVTFSEVVKSSAFGEGQNPRYDIVFRYTDSMAGIALMGCTNTYSVTAPFEDKSSALDALDKYSKGLPCDIIGVTLELPDGVQRNAGEEWQDCHFVRFACPKGTEEQCAKLRMSQILKQAKNTENDYWRLVD